MLATGHPSRSGQAWEEPGEILSGGRRAPWPRDLGIWRRVGPKKPGDVARTDRKECTDYGNFLDVHQAGGMVDRMH